MYSLTERRRALAGDSGNLAIVFVLILVSLFGAGTLAVDFGQVYAERRQLQNGAENGALAVAATCTRPGVNCSTMPASHFADQNANDTRSTVDVVCGTGPGLPGCPARLPGNRWNCSTTTPSARYVEVRTTTRTQQPNGTDNNRVTNIFFRGVNPADPGKTVRSCARAAYGTPAGMTSQLPLTISHCDWNTATSNGSTFAASPPYTTSTFPPASQHRTIYFHSGTTTDDCAGPGGQNLPGGFGWIDTTRDADGSSTSGCQAVTSSSGTVSSDPGVSAPSTCNLSGLLGRPIYVPVYDQTAGTGNTATYTIRGYAAFYMTGYRFSQQDRGYAAPLTNYPCTPSQGQCISGYFTAAITTDINAVLGTGPSMGVTVVQPAG